MKKTIFYCYIIGCISLYSCHTNQQPTSDTNIASDTLPLKDFVAGIHPPFKECHASTLIHLKNGQFLVAWFAGTKEKNDDVGIWLVKGRPHQWSAPRQVAKIRHDAHWNPVLFQSSTGKIFLFFKN